MWDDDVLKQDGSREEGEKWLNSRFILKVDLTGVADGLDVGNVRKSKDKNDSRL